MAQINILVTGTSRGIGKAVLGQFQMSGANVIGHASQNGTAAYEQIAVDLSDPGGAAFLWNAALKKFGGKIDVLVNNAGIFEANKLDAPADEWNASWARTMQVNLTAATQLCRLAVLHWQKTATGGRIVNIASRAAHRGDSPDHWHYAASKAGMVAVTKTIARAYAKDGIYAFAICPGFTMTGMAEEYLESRGGDKLLADIPLGRVATPDEIASMAVFCATSAPPSMTGCILDANGASYVR